MRCLVVLLLSHDATRHMPVNINSISSKDRCRKALVDVSLVLKISLAFLKG